MNEKKWYKTLLKKVHGSYSDRIIVKDNGGFSVNTELKEELSKEFLLHDYESELKLREFIEKNRGSKMLIFKKPQTSYLPYDIEEKSEIVCWQESDVDLEYQYEERTKDKRGVFLDALLTDLSSYLESIDKLLEQEKDKINWGKASYEWGYASFLIDKYRLNTLYADENQIEKTVKKARVTEERLKELFTDFVFSNYKNLFYESFISAPVTVDRVLAYLSQQRPGKKVLICFDGMGFQEWFSIKEYLEHKKISNFQEGHVFALLPTVTSISRRALFSGERNYKRMPEEKKGFNEYVKKNWPGGKSNESLFFPNAKIAFNPDYFSGEYVGIIFNLIDNLIHQFKDMDNSKKLFQNNLSIILGNTELDEIIAKFLEEDFRVFLTSDHGSVWSQGMGLKQDKHLLEERAKRACLFNNELLAKDFLKADKELRMFKFEEIFEEKCTVFSPWRKMFGNVDHNEITHGGMHLEEVVVPFVEVLK